MKELLERLRGATGPDRTIDGDLASVFRQVPPRFTRRPFPGQPYWDDGQLRRPATWRAPIYTASLDAALALVERCRPDGARPADWLVWMCQEPSCWHAHLYRYVGGKISEGDAPTAPLALLIALLGALSGRPEAEDGTEDQSNGTNNNPSLSKPNQ